MTDSKIYVCSRVEDGPALVNSVECPCARCDSKVWVDKNMLDFADETTVVCMQCAVPDINDPETQLSIHSRQVPTLSAMLAAMRRRN